MIKATILIILGVFLLSEIIKIGAILIIIAGMMPLDNKKDKAIKPKINKRELRLQEARRRQKLLHRYKDYHEIDRNE